MNDDSQPATKGDLKFLRIALEQKMAAMQQETMRYLALSLETFRHDFLSVDKDEKTMIKEKHNGLERRVVRIEDSLGLAA